GFWFSHLGWIFNTEAAAADYSRVPDLTRYPELMWLNRNRFLPGIVLGLLCFLGFGWAGLFVGFFWSTVLLYHSTFAINSVAHVLGRPRYLTGDESKNNFWLAMLTLGEGWHNNHHYYMASARQGFYWWEIDLTYYALRLLGVFNIVWDIKEPPAHVLAGQRKVGDQMMDQIARRVAGSFCAETISHKVREKFAALTHSAADARTAAMAELVKAELPSMDEIRRKAARMFAKTEALAEVVERARERLALAVSQRVAADAAC
ncbi:MAG: acyl-CoA desaturase, partial [Stenotrophobium sp.]